MPSFLAVVFPSHNSSSSRSSRSNDTYCLYSDQLISFTGSVIYLTALPALAVAARVTHKYGRKPTMWAIVLLLASGAAAGAAANNLAAVFASRALLGMAMGCRHVQLQKLALSVCRAARSAGATIRCRHLNSCCV